MAKLIEDVLIIKVSKLFKDSDAAESLIAENTVAEIEQVLVEMLGKNVMVEIEQA